MEETIDIPGYRIVRELGSGGMAKVYLAVQQSFDRQVALKVMSPLLRLDPSFSERFMREAHIVSQMFHSSIVPVYDAGEYGEYHYLAMEYLPGGDLKERLRTGITPQLAFHVCFAIASALDSAHRKGFVHRDIKPENILFRADDTPVLTDFGIARAIDSGSSMTRTGMLVGTPTYMSPEQVSGEELDGRSDLYSLGIVFYEMLTGAAPFRAESTISVAVKQLQESLPPLPSVFARYQPFLDRLTAKDRNQRFSNGAEAAHALSALGVVEAGSAPPRMTSGVTEPTLLVIPPQMTPRKRPPWVWFSGSAAALLFTATALFLTQLEVPQARTAPALLSAPLQPMDISTLPPEQRELLRRAESQVQASNFAGAEESYLQALAMDRNNSLARAGLDHLASLRLAGARGAMQQESLEMARRELMAALRLAPNHPDIPAVQTDLQAAYTRHDRSEAARQAAMEKTSAAQRAAALQQQQKAQQRLRQIQKLLGEAERAVERGQLMQPAGDSAVDHYNDVLALDPGNSAALDGLHQLSALLQRQGGQAFVGDDDADAGKHSIVDIDSGTALLPQLQAQERDYRRQLALIDHQLEQRRELEERAGRYIKRGERYLERQPVNLRVVHAATRHYDKAQRLAPQSAELQEFKLNIQHAYAAAARTALRNGRPADARAMVEYARKRNWLTTELQLIDGTARRQASRD